MRVIFMVGQEVSLHLMYGEFKLREVLDLEDLIKTPDDSDRGFFIECDLTYPVNTKEKTTKFLFCPEIEVSPHDKFKKFVNELELIIYTPYKNIFCDWIDKKKYLIHHTLLKSYVRQRVVIDKIHEVTSFKQTKWLQKIRC